MLQEIDSFYKELGERIKTQRLKLRFTQEELAEHLDLTRSSVVNFEKGRHRPSLYQIIQIANFLSLDYVKLVPFAYEKEQRTQTEIDLKNVITDDGKLDASTTKAINTFMSDVINKE